MEKTTPAQFYRQIKQYRLRYPGKGLIHGVPGTRQHAWAALMAGVSMLVGQLPYPDLEDPSRYISPQRCLTIESSYDFIRAHLSRSLWHMKPSDLVRGAGQTTWCLADPGQTYLVYALHGGRFQLDLSAANGPLRANWFDPRTGKLQPAHRGSVDAAGMVTFNAPDDRDWVLWLDRDAMGSGLRFSVFSGLKQF